LGFLINRPRRKHLQTIISKQQKYKATAKNMTGFDLASNVIKQHLSAELVFYPFISFAFLNLILSRFPQSPTV